MGPQAGAVAVADASTASSFPQAEASDIVDVDGCGDNNELGGNGNIEDTDDGVDEDGDGDGDDCDVLFGLPLTLQARNEVTERDERNKVIAEVFCRKPYFLSMRT